MYCPSCGAENIDTARFCNMCGAKIDPNSGDAGATQFGLGLEEQAATAVKASEAGRDGSPGAPGGAPASAIPDTPLTQQPMDESGPSDLYPGFVSSATSAAPGISAPGISARGPSQGPSTGGFSAGASSASMSLQAIGVRSSGRVWAVIAFSAVLLVALGAAGAWFGMQSSAPEEVGEAEPDDPFVIGAPSPANESEDAVDFVAGRPGGGPASQASERYNGRTSSGESARTGSSRSGRKKKSPKSSTSADKKGGARAADRKTGSSPRAQTGAKKSSAENASSSNPEAPSTTSGSTTSGSKVSGSTTPDSKKADSSQQSGTIPSEAFQERDIAMDLYGSRVRSVVRRYYAARAQTCFDRATRNKPTLHGVVVVRMNIKKDGQVGTASVVRNSTGDKTLGQCLTGQVRTWKVPPPPGGALAMEMPFSR